MSGFVSRETPVQIKGPDGTVLYEGAVNLGLSEVYSVTAGGATVSAGMGCRVDQANITFPYWSMSTASDPISLQKFVLRPGSGALGFVGVAYSQAAAGIAVEVAGPGSLIAALTSAVAIAAGAGVGDGNASGQMVATSTVGAICGTCIKPNSATAQPTGMGTTAYVAMFVMPR